MSKCVVIDADVIGGAGHKADALSHRSARCREVLRCILDLCHRAATTPEIEAQWEKSKHDYAASWLVAMKSKGKLVPVSPRRSVGFRSCIARTASTRRDKRLIAEDVHLVEAALAADRLVVSCDETVRALFEAAATAVHELEGLAWYNPERHAPRSIYVWLKCGAEPTARMRLG